MRSYSGIYGYRNRQSLQQFIHFPHVSYFPTPAKISAFAMSTQETSTSGSGPPHSVPDHRHHELSLGEYELSGGNRRAPFILTWAEVKLLGIAGVST